jgi:pimeloyl-[acyl-carrier protein] methyl ester esterase
MKVLVLPGLDGTGLLLEEFARLIGAEHHVEVIAYPGDLATYGSLETWLETRLPQEEFAMVAESFSGPLAIRIASQNPKYLKATVLVATFARRPRPVSSALFAIARLFPYFQRIVAQASLPFVVGRERPENFVSVYESALQGLAWPILVNRVQSVLQIDVRELLTHVRSPVAYIIARNDRLVPAHISREFEPYCRLFQSIDAPHFVLQTKPFIAAKIVLDFLSSLDASDRIDTSTK